MSRTTGPILALGTITVVNATVFNDRPMDWRVPVGTGLAMIGFNLAERVFPDGAQILAWTALLTAVVTRLDPRTPSPVESATAWWSSSKGGGGSSGTSGSREV
jgi:hypothetical protein